MKKLITISFLFVANMLSAHDMPVVYLNNPEILEKANILSKSQFEKFYSDLESASDKDAFMSATHIFEPLPEGRFADIVFFIRSPEVTPAVPGYVAYKYYEGNHGENFANVNEVAEVPYVLKDSL